MAAYILFKTFLLSLSRFYVAYTKCFNLICCVFGLFRLLLCLTSASAQFRLLVFISSSLSSDTVFTLLDIYRIYTDSLLAAESCHGPKPVLETHRLDHPISVAHLNTCQSVK